MSEISEQTIQAIYKNLTYDPLTVPQLACKSGCGETTARTALEILRKRGMAKSKQSKQFSEFNKSYRVIRRWVRV